MSGNANYLSSQYTSPVETKKITSVFNAASAIALALIVLVMTFLPLGISSLTNNNSGSPDQHSVSVGQAEASLFCSPGLGVGMGDKNDWTTPLSTFPNGESENRVFTAQEAFANNAFFVNFYGENENPGWFFFARDVNQEAWGDNPRMEDIQSSRGGAGCIINPLGRTVANLGLALANGFSFVSGAVISWAFNPEFICQPNAPEGTVCFNLLGFIGGDGGSEEGLIASLTKSIYFPLLVLMSVLSGMWIIWEGGKRRVRSALGGALWSIVVVMLGIGFLGNPQLLARAPMEITNTMASCVIGVMGGDNCLTGERGVSLVPENGTSSRDNLCVSSSNGSGIGSGKTMSMTVNSINCQIWKSFVLNPISYGSFGTSFERLDAYSPQVRPLIEKAGYSPEDFCVNMGSSRSADSMKNGILVLDKSDVQICNLMIYQAFLSSKASMQPDITIDALNNPESRDADWYKLVNVIAQDQGMWSSWNSNNSMGFTEDLTMSGLAVFMSIVGGLILMAIGLSALMFYILSLIMLIFAPFFLLFAAHPGRGKRIFFGWLENVVGYLIKYVVSALFLVITIAFYGAALAGMDNILMTMIFIILISLVLWYYRSEIMELIGRVNMGGEQIGRKTTDALKQRFGNDGERWKRVSRSAMGGAVGSAFAGGSLRAGITDGATRELKKGNTTLAATMRAMDRTSLQNRKELKAKMEQSANAVRNAEATHNAAASSYNTVKQDAEGRSESVRDHQAKLSYLDQNKKANDQAAQDVLYDMQESEYNKHQQFINDINNDESLSDEEKQEAISQFEQTSSTKSNQQMYADLAELKELENAIRDMKLNIQVAEANGEDTTALENQLQDLKDEKKELMGRHSTEEWNNAKEKFEMEFETELSIRDIDRFDADSESAMVEHVVKLAEDKEALANIADDVTNRGNDLAIAASTLAASKIAHDAYSNKYYDLNASDLYTHKDAERTENEVMKSQDVQRVIDGQMTPEEFAEKWNGEDYMDTNYYQRFSDSERVMDPEDEYDVQDFKDKWGNDATPLNTNALKDNANLSHIEDADRFRRTSEGVSIDEFDMDTASRRDFNWEDTIDPRGNDDPNDLPNDDDLRDPNGNDDPNDLPDDDNVNSGDNEGPRTRDYEHPLDSDRTTGRFNTAADDEPIDYEMPTPETMPYGYDDSYSDDLPDDDDAPFVDPVTNENYTQEEVEEMQAAGYQFSTPDADKPYTREDLSRYSDEEIAEMYPDPAVSASNRDFDVPARSNEDLSRYSDEEIAEMYPDPAVSTPARDFDAPVRSNEDLSRYSDEEIAEMYPDNGPEVSPSMDIPPATTSVDATSMGTETIPPVVPVDPVQQPQGQYVDASSDSTSNQDRNVDNAPEVETPVETGSTTARNEGPVRDQGPVRDEVPMAVPTSEDRRVPSGEMPDVISSTPVESIVDRPDETLTRVESTPVEGTRDPVQTEEVRTPRSSDETSRVVNENNDRVVPSVDNSDDRAVPTQNDNNVLRDAENDLRDADAANRNAQEYLRSEAERLARAQQANTDTVADRAVVADSLSEGAIRDLPSRSDNMNDAVVDREGVAPTIPVREAPVASEKRQNEFSAQSRQDDVRAPQIDSSALPENIVVDDASSVAPTPSVDRNVATPVNNVDTTPAESRRSNVDATEARPVINETRQVPSEKPAVVENNESAPRVNDRIDNVVIDRDASATPSDTRTEAPRAEKVETVKPQRDTPVEPKVVTVEKEVPAVVERTVPSENNASQRVVENDSQTRPSGEGSSQRRDGEETTLVDRVGSFFRSKDESSTDGNDRRSENVDSNRGESDSTRQKARSISDNARRIREQAEAALREADRIGSEADKVERNVGSRNVDPRGTMADRDTDSEVRRYMSENKSEPDNKPKLRRVAPKVDRRMKEERDS